MSILQSVVINEQVRLSAGAGLFLAHGDALHAVITGQEKSWLIGREGEIHAANKKICILQTF